MIILVVIALVILISIVMFIQKVVLKGRLESRLGRRVKDNELTSIAAWMDASPESKPSPGVPLPVSTREKNLRR